MCNRNPKSRSKLQTRVGEERYSATPNRLAAPTCPAFSEPNMADLSSPRLVIDADCTTCGPIASGGSDGILIIRSALAHSATTKHVVILNGTTDVPEADQLSLLP